MIYLLFILATLTGFRVGYNYRELVEQVHSLQKLPETRKRVKEAKQSSPSVLIDPDNLEQMIRLDHDETMRKLNPELYDENGSRL